MADTTKLLRQWMLLRMLSTRAPGVSVQEMASETVVDLKTIRRDLDDLRSVGFPLEETRVEHGRKLWRVDPTADRTAWPFTLEEVLALYVTRRYAEPLAGTCFWRGSQSAYAKLRASLGRRALAYLDRLAAVVQVKVVGTTDYSSRADLIDGLMTGIEDQRIAFVTYRSDGATEPVSYEVYPFGLVHFKGTLYLVAFAPHHDDIRHYKVDRIAEVDVQPLRFVKPSSFDLSAHLSDSFGIWRSDGPAQRIRVRFVPPAARYVQERRWHESQRIREMGDGSIVAEFRLADPSTEFLRWILGFGSRAVVLEPDSLVRLVRAEIAGTIAGYGEDAHPDAPNSRQAARPTPTPRRRSTPR